MTAAAHAVRAALAALADPVRAGFQARFLRAYPGAYGEGDVLWGLTVPATRRVVRAHLPGLALADLEALLDDPVHECRAAALMGMTARYTAARTSPADRDALASSYLARLDRVDNWDLVDGSAPVLVGTHLAHRDRGLLDELAATGHLWRQRVAMVA